MTFKKKIKANIPDDIPPLTYDSNLTKFFLIWQRTSPSTKLICHDYR